MSTRTILTVLAALILSTLAAGGLQNNPTYAQSGTATATASATATDDDLDPRVEISGTIKLITQQSPSVLIIVLDDGTQVLVNPASQGATNLQVGQAVTIIASVDDELLVAKIMTTVSATAEPTSAATIPATIPATVPATVVATASATPAATGAATESASCGGNGGQQPVAARLADAFGVSYDEIMAWHCKGIGFGNIAKAYLLAQKTGKSAADYLNMHASGKGWGQIKKESGVDPRELAPGQVINGKKNKGDDATAVATSSASDDKGNKDGNDDKGNNGNKDNKGNNGNSGNKGGNSGGKSNGNGGNKGGNGSGGKGGGKK